MFPNLAAILQSLLQKFPLIAKKRRMSVQICAVMRKLLLMFVCLSSIFQLNAQERIIKATPAKMEYHSPASKAAATDPGVQEFINSKTNEVLYLKENVCKITGLVSYDTLEYCSKGKRFVSITPVKAVRSSCVRSKGVPTQMVKAPVVNNRSSVEYLRAQKAACSSASSKVKNQVRLVKKGSQ